ncbi:MAG: adenosylmethionine--8-amino-7-oxononanoate transaminase, partial [Actinomycetota bacterium]
MTLVRSRLPVAGEHASSYSSLLESNGRFLWNPFTQMQDYLRSEPVIVAGGSGVKLTDVEGNEYYDGNSSLWVNIHGHNRAEINRAITAQLEKVSHSTLLGMGNIPAIELAEKLVSIAPGSLAKVFYSDSGATAVEIAVKMAFAYWRRIGRPEKAGMLAFTNAYHGDTVACMSLGGIDIFRADFEPLMMPVGRVPFPDVYRFGGTAQECAVYCLSELEKTLQREAGRTACLITEPMIQGAAGMVTMPPGFMGGVTQLCRDFDVLLIADEVATGFGRTGRMFACEHEEVTPDLMAIGKGLTGGYLPLAATLATDRIYDAFTGSFEQRKTFFHGHSFTGNQLACAAALASLELFETDRLIQRTAGSAEVIRAGLSPLRDLDNVGDIRQLGMMAGVELVEDRASRRPYARRRQMGMTVCR